LVLGSQRRIFTDAGLADWTRELDEADLQNMLAAMIECGEEFERRVMAGERYAFSNITTALHEIHKGTHRPYPCGAGGAYLGVSADGGLAACHRFVGDEAGAMGSIEGGIDHDRKTAWLEDRHVHRQQPCRTCWARYLCGGGCHHEVIARGRPACDFIRGWLLYALQTYLRLGPKVSAERSARDPVQQHDDVGHGSARDRRRSGRRSVRARAVADAQSVILCEEVSFPRDHIGICLSPGLFKQLEFLGARHVLEHPAHRHGLTVEQRWGSIDPAVAPFEVLVADRDVSIPICSLRSPILRREFCSPPGSRS